MVRRRAGGTCGAVLTLAAVAMLLSACGAGNDIVQVRATSPSPTSAAPTTTASSTPPSASSSSTAAGTSTVSTSGTSTATDPASTTTGATTTSKSAAAPAATTSAGSTPRRTTPTAAARPARPGAPGWPRALGEPQQGQLAWGVYLGIGHAAAEPVVEKAVRQAAAVGYSAVVGDIACDVGAMEALGLDQFDYWTGATLYFGSHADARTFAASYAAAIAKPKGVVKVKVGCLD